ncbi:hypothetical protein [Pseudomonas azotoformans]
MDNKVNLENLQRSGGLKAEPPDRKECDGLMRSARDRLRDAGNPQLSFASQPLQEAACLLVLCYSNRNDPPPSLIDGPLNHS